MLNRGLFAGALLIAYVGPIQAQMAAPVDSALARQVDAIANQVLQSTGVPSASVAVVKNGRVAYANAYGAAKLDPRLPATPDLRYAIGSISKQFTAVAILLLQQDGKLRLDDPVSRFIPGFTRGNEVTVRQLLSHTSGYQDFWPQDYVMTVDPDMRRPVSSADIMRRWATIPLDFEPGSAWQYSNTNYVIAAAIVERASNMKFMDFLRLRILTPLHMTSVADFDAGWMNAQDAQPLLRNGLGPL
ncbi:MAG: serine hydrolase domain-containing protein, partial [Gemmatimonadaceae bacterium]